jgi:short-subunit dehydrogenase
VIGARNEDRGLEALRELKSEGIEAGYLNIDLKDQKTILSAADTIKSQHADLAMLIKLIAAIILDGKNHNGEVINENGAIADYNYGLY